MLIERPPRAYRMLYRHALWRADRHIDGSPAVYLTFDDGPVQAVTDKVLDILGQNDIRATFFMVADNARRYPRLAARVRAERHVIGNHTTHHLQGLYTPTRAFMRDVELADSILGPCRLFRPPHGLLRPAQYKLLSQRYKVVFHDLVTRDYSHRLSAQDVVDNVRRYSRPGSIIVFHDSAKGAPRMLDALPRALQWLKERGYVFGTL